MYRLGFPGWKLAARLGVPLVFGVRVHKDEAFGTYWAESNDMARSKDARVCSEGSPDFSDSRACVVISQCKMVCLS